MMETSAAGLRNKRRIQIGERREREILNTMRAQFLLFFLFSLLLFLILMGVM